MHHSNFRCRFCLKEKSAAGSEMMEGQRYCAQCVRFFRVSTNENAKPPRRPREPEPTTKRPHGTVRWWDAKHKEWRWVSRKSKPELKPRQ